MEIVRKAFFQLPSEDKNNAEQWFSVCKKIGKVTETNVELEVLKIVACFLEGHGKYDSNLISFEIKSLKQTKFFVTVSKSTQKEQNAK